MYKNIWDTFGKQLANLVQLDYKSKRDTEAFMRSNKLLVGLEKWILNTWVDKRYPLEEIRLSLEYIHYVANGEMDFCQDVKTKMARYYCVYP